MRQRVRAVIGVGAIAAAFGLLAGPAPAHSGFALPAASLTTAAPVLDGVMNAGEWGSASSFVFPAGEADGRVWAMHDGNYVYFAFRRIDTTPGTSAAFQVYFDNAHDGALNSGDDAWSASVNVSTGASFTNDAAYTPGSCPSCWPDDTSLSGTNDTEAGATYTSGTGEAVFEMRHRRCTTDVGRDLCLPADGSLAGITFLYFSASSTVFYPAAFSAPGSYGDFSLVPAAADTTPPETTITSGPTDYGAGTQAIFLTESSEPGSSFECRRVPDAFGVCAPSHQYDGLTAASYTFEIRAKDAAGNVDPTPAVYRWTVDTVPFVGTLDQHNGRVLSTTGGRSIGGVDNPRLAQIFTPPTSGAILEARAGVSCSSTQLITAQILGTTGGRPDESNVLASTAVSVSPRATFTRFQFAGAPALSAATEYAFVLRGPIASGCYAFMAEDTYPGKVYWDDESASTPSGWIENAAPEDIGFATFTGAGAPASFVVTNTNDSG
ncbi:MAG: large repetitive protein, partial [Gaiellaceae bacterium]|nr:large repetitive protein [Gaiellaceae bacterium]